MNSKHNFLLFKAVLLIIMLFSFVQAQNYHVKVTTVNGNEIFGLLLKISSKGVRIDPDGPVSFRFIKSNNLQSVYVEELDMEFTYPLDDSALPAELSGQLEINTSSLGGFPDFAISGALGQTSPGGDYYEGFESCMTYHFRAIYFFPDDDRYASRFFVSFAYYNSSSPPEHARVLIGYNYYDPVYMVMDDLKINQYALEFGRTTDAMNNDSYLFFLFGVTYITHEIKMSASAGDIYVADSWDEDKAAIRLEGGGVIGINPHLGITLSAGIDLVLSKKKENSYGYSDTQTTASGTLLNFAAGLIYDF